MMKQKEGAQRNYKTKEDEWSVGQRHRRTKIRREREKDKTGEGGRGHIAEAEESVSSK